MVEEVQERQKHEGSGNRSLLFSGSSRGRRGEDGRNECSDPIEWWLICWTIPTSKLFHFIWFMATIAFYYNITVVSESSKWLGGCGRSRSRREDDRNECSGWLTDWTITW